jgi:hypothetical protein
MTIMSLMKVVLALPLLLGGAVASDKRRINPAGPVDTVIDEYAQEDEVFWGRNLELILESLSMPSTAHPNKPPTPVGHRHRPEQYTAQIYSRQTPKIACCSWHVDSHGKCAGWLNEFYLLIFKLNFCLFIKGTPPPTPSPTPWDCEHEYTDWLNCVIGTGMICDSCVPGFPNLMDQPGLIPREACDDFLKFYKGKKDCCELEECQEFLEILLDCKMCDTPPPTAGPTPNSTPPTTPPTSSPTTGQTLFAAPPPTPAPAPTSDPTLPVSFPSPLFVLYHNVFLTI